jgi:ribose transport system ATP-binding protein
LEASRVERERSHGLVGVLEREARLVNAAAGVTTATVVSVGRLTKRFGGTLALDEVDFDVREGEIHALLGENGAGKSTLIKILAGVHVPDGDEILVHGERVDPRSERLPISFIHQDLGLVEDMTVAENVAVTAGYKRRWGLISWRAIRRQAREALTAMGHGVDVRAKIARLPAAERAVVGIARALAVKAEVLVLDEPTAPLPEADVERLFSVLRRLRESGMGVIYVTHRLDEVFRVSDRVTVLRDGRKVFSGRTDKCTGSELVGHIVGREVGQVFKRPPEPIEQPALELENVIAGPVGPVSLVVRQGEIVAFVGLRGAGHHLLGRAIAGVAPLTDGFLKLDGREINLPTPRAALAEGLSFLPSNRGDEALFGGQNMAPTLTVQENLFPNPASKVLPGRPRAERRAAWRLVNAFTIRPRDPSRPVTMLSGGNQQKVVLARTMNVGRHILALEEPTAGVDVGAKADIYALMSSALQEGKAIILVSSDFEEVAHIAHRAFVFISGRIVAEVPESELTVERLTTLASGAA